MKSRVDLAAAKDAVYFLTNTNNTDIPKYLSLMTISNNTARDHDQNKLYCLLGVQRASPELIMGLISDHHHAISVAPTTGNILAEYMHILCYVIDSCAKDDRLKKPCLMVANERQRRLLCRTSCPRHLPCNIYLRTEGAYRTTAIA